MDCWRVNGVTGSEILNTRHKKPCSDTCFIRCPIRECGDLGEYGPCNGSCGIEGIQPSTKHCWMKDGETGIEIPGSRHTIEYSATCMIPCVDPERVCSACGEYGPCSESCGAEGIAESTRDCWLQDMETKIELPGYRQSNACTKTCFVLCPTTTTELCKVYESLNCCRTDLFY